MTCEKTPQLVSWTLAHRLAMGVDRLGSRERDVKPDPSGCRPVVAESESSLSASLVRAPGVRRSRKDRSEPVTRVRTRLAVLPSNARVRITGVLLTVASTMFSVYN